MQKVNFKDYDTVFFNSKSLFFNCKDLLSIPLLVVLSFLLERQEAITTYDKYFGIYADENESEFYSLLWGIVVSSACTFAISYSTSWCIRINGPTTYRYLFIQLTENSMVGALNKLPIAVFGMIFFDAVVSVASVSSIVVGKDMIVLIFVSVWCWSFIQLCKVVPFVFCPSNVYQSRFF
jgi:GDP-mannose transporter